MFLILLHGMDRRIASDRPHDIRPVANNAQPALIKVSIAKAKRDGSENLRISKGDLVTVESTVATMTVDTVSNFFRIGLGLSGNMAAF